MYLKTYVHLLMQLINLFYVKHSATAGNDFDFGINVTILPLHFPDGVIDFDFTLTVFYRLIQVESTPYVL